MSRQVCCCHGRLTRPNSPRIPGLYPAPGIRHSRLARRAAISTSDLARLTGLELEDTVSLLDRCPRLAAVDEELARKNITQLRALYKAHTVTQLVRKRPELLTVELGSWLQFLSGYGLTESALWKVLRYSSPQLLAGGDNTPYNTGAAIVFLKSYGWTDDGIAERVLPCYPEVLAATQEELQGAVDFLRSRNFDEDAIRRLVQCFPQLLVPRFNADLFTLVDRIRASAHNKYVVSGSYHV